MIKKIYFKWLSRKFQEKHQNIKKMRRTQRSHAGINLTSGVQVMIEISLLQKFKQNISPVSGYVCMEIIHLDLIIHDQDDRIL